MTDGSTATRPGSGQRPDAVGAQPPSSKHEYIVTRAGPLQAIGGPIGGTCAPPASVGSTGPTSAARTQPPRPSEGSRTGRRPYLASPSTRSGAHRWASPTSMACGPASDQSDVST